MGASAHSRAAAADMGASAHSHSTAAEMSTAAKVTAAAHGVRSATAAGMAASTAAGMAASTSASSSWRRNSGTGEHGEQRGNGEELGFGHDTLGNAWDVSDQTTPPDIA